MRNTCLCLLHALLVFALVYGALGLAAPGVQAQDATPDTPPPAALPPDQMPDQVDEEFEIEPMPDLSPWIKRVRLNVTQDAYIASGRPDANLGGLAHMNMGYQLAPGEQAVRPVMQFDLNGIPSKARVQSARLNFYQYQTVPTGLGNTNIVGRKMVAPWGEHSITWHNARYDGGSTGLGSVTASTGWQVLDLHAILQSWVNGQANYGVVLTGNEVASATHLRSFRTREAGGGTAPFVDVEYICDTKTPLSNVVHPLPTYAKASFTVTWSGEDRAPSHCTPSGLHSFDLEYRVGSSGTWHKLNKGRYPVAQMSDSVHHGSDGETIYIRWRGLDNVGNKENYGNAETHTTVDSLPPQTAMTPLPPFTTATSFTIQWSGTDHVSGVADYDVEYRLLMPGADSSWTRLLTGVTETSHLFTGAAEGGIYEFRTRARDNAGNEGVFPETAQASTTIDLNPHAIVDPFNPPILKPTAPVTETFTVHWTGYAVGGATITEYQLFYNYNGEGWKEWTTFPGTETQAQFPYLSMSMGDGVYQFEATATDSAGHTKPRTDTPEATMIVDLADKIHPGAYLPVVHR
ncbi:MAG: fibronectin type III domain-containing protein [Caldilineaceae bacterium]|nr:fibronectin type III domain-containing protein [Caldilineaceae bacterium]